MAKELAKILKPLVSKSPHHINSTQDFVEQVRHITLVPGECLSSYNMSALFTSVPIDPALQIIKDLLVKDPTLKDRTVIGVNDIILLLVFCLKNTYFTFQGQFFEPVEGGAMGSPVSPIVANLYMGVLRAKCPKHCTPPPRFWCRFVDDTFVIHKEVNKQDILKSKGHIVISYTQGLCESIKKICGRYGIQTHFKGGCTIKNLLVSPKDKDSMVSQCGAIYWYQFGDLTCDDEYIGETSRTFGERYKEHLKDPSPIHHHNNQTNHPINHNNFKIIEREGHHLSRYIKESIFIRVNNSTLNNNVGKLTYPIYGTGF